MRFTRTLHYGPRPITQRRIATAERALKRERDKYPLLSDWIAEQQPTALERVQGFQQQAADARQNRRQANAQTWRRARARLRSCHPDVQRAVLDAWNRSHQPGTCEYFANFVWYHACCDWPHPYHKQKHHAVQEKRVICQVAS